MGGHKANERSRLVRERTRSSSGEPARYDSVPLDEPDVEAHRGESSPSPVRASSAPPRSLPASVSPSTWRSCQARLDSFFLVSERGSSLGQEARAGAVTFVTMAYIIVVNAQILSKSSPDSSGAVLPFDTLVLATALSAALGSVMVGVCANLPFALAPGMGLNSYFTYGVCLKLGMSWRVALTCCFMQGLLFVVLALLGFCELLQHHAPQCIKQGVTVGLGLFQALVGFELMQLVVPGEQVLLALGDLDNAHVWVGLAGIIIICVLMLWEVKGAMLVGMILITVAAWLLDPSTAPSALVSLPPLPPAPFELLDFPSFFSGPLWQPAFMVTAVLLFVSILDTAGVQSVCGSGAGLMDEQGRLPGSKMAFMAAGVATTVGPWHTGTHEGACLGTSPVIIHNETFAGIADGARTGLHSVVVALLFLVTLPFVPVLRAVPSIATAAPLVIVGMHMMAAAAHVRWSHVAEAMPAFLCAAILPLTYSIANGMMFGVGAYALLHGAEKIRGRADAGAGTGTGTGTGTASDTEATGAGVEGGGMTGGVGGGTAATAALAAVQASEGEGTPRRAGGQERRATPLSVLAR